MLTVTPAYTTTQVLLSNTESCILPQRIIDLSMLLQSNSKIQGISSYGIGPLQPKLFNDTPSIQTLTPPAKQLKRPAWVETHIYRRASPTNSDNLRILTTELNMIRALKITRPLKPRRPYSSKRSDEFIWGRPSPLRNVTY